MARPIHTYDIPGFGDRGSITVNGFGACMIAGTPYTINESFLVVAADFVRAVSGIGVRGRVHSYGAFSASRAAKYIGKALADKPDVVVVQLGTTDASTSIRRHLLGAPKRTEQEPGVHAEMPGFHRSRTRAVVEWLKLWCCRLLHVTPIHGDVTVYMNAMTEIVRRVQEAGAVAVVVSPFPHGDRATDFHVREFTSALDDLCSETGAVFVNTGNNMRCYNLSEILLRDRMHLSRAGHRAAGHVLADKLLAVVVEKALDKLPPR